MRLIDVEAINWYDDLFMKGVNHSGVWVRYRDVEHLIRTAPTVDAVEVVRCKDCVPVICPLNGRHKSDDDYCSFAIPREEFWWR